MPARARALVDKLRSCEGCWQNTATAACLAALNTDEFPLRALKLRALTECLFHTLQMTFRMHRADGLFQSVAPHRNRDRKFARTLRDGDDVDALPRNGRKDPAGQP